MKRITNATLILLVRSLGKAVGVPNRGFGGLGHYFGGLICTQLGGNIIADNVPADWTRVGITGTTGNFSLPLTSAEFELPSHQLSRLFDIIFAMN
jgi:hypothetical protein